MAVRPIIDSGQDHELTLPRSILERHPEVLSVNVTGAAAAVGVGGRIAVRRGWVKSLELFDVTLLDVPVSFEDVPVAGVGRIGHRLLRHFRLTFDTRRGVVRADWQPRIDP